MKVNGVQVIPRGARVEGRVTRLEHRDVRAKLWWVGLRLERILSADAVVPLHASLTEPRLIGSKERKLAGAPGKDILLVVDSKVDLKPGLLITWRTE